MAITADVGDGRRDELLIHPRCVVAAVGGSDGDVAGRIHDALAAQRLAPLALAALVAPADLMGDEALEQAAATLCVPLRFVEIDRADDSSGRVAHRLLPAAVATPHETFSDSTNLTTDVALAVSSTPLDPARHRSCKGRLSVVGLGPGDASQMTPAVRTALSEATDIVGYATYVDMAGPFRADQRLHSSDNREELQRARHAFDLASSGRHVVVVSSGDPGVFAMAAAVLEALDVSGDARWARVDLRILPACRRRSPPPRWPARRLATTFACCRFPTISSRGRRLKNVCGMPPMRIWRWPSITRFRAPVRGSWTKR